MKINLEALRDKLIKSLKQKTLEPAGYVGTPLTTDEINYILNDIEMVFLMRDILEIKK